MSETEIKGTCHCGSVEWTFLGKPEGGTTCNCTICRKYGTIWAYGFVAETVTITGHRKAYMWGDKEILFHHCPNCGCITDWTGRHAREDGRIRIAVNLRLAEPYEVADIPIRRFDGFGAFETRPDIGRVVHDIW